MREKVCATGVVFAVTKGMFEVATEFVLIFEIGVSVELLRESEVKVKVAVVVTNEALVEEFVTVIVANVRSHALGKFETLA